MLGKMAWRDLRRRPGESGLIVLLIGLSTLLAGLSVGLLVDAVSSSGRLLDSGRAPDLVQMHLGELDQPAIDAWTTQQEGVTAQRTQDLLTLDGERIAIAGTSQEGSLQQPSLTVPSADLDILTGPEGQAVAEVAPGTVWLPVYYQIEHGVELGDDVVIRLGDRESLSLEVVGFHRDAIMNTAVASSKRLAVSAEDFEAVAAQTGQMEHLISFWLDDSSRASQVSADYQSAGLPSSGPVLDRTQFQVLNMIGDGLVALVIVLCAGLLLVVGLLCLRLTAVTAMQRELRELGVLRAIGAPARFARRVMIVRYGLLAVIGAGLGALLAGLLLPVIVAGSTAYSGRAPGMGSGLGVLVTAAVIVLIVIAALAWTARRIDRVPPVAALRGGTGAGRRPLRALRLSRGRRRALSWRLGLVELGARRGTAVLLGVIFGLAAFIAILPSSAAVTVASPGFIDDLGIARADLRLERPGAQAEADDLAEPLAASPQVESSQVFTRLRARVPGPDGQDQGIALETGDHEAAGLSTVEGRAPRGPDEISLSLAVLADSDMAIGDRISVLSGGASADLVITGAYQDLTNGGRTGRTPHALPGGDVQGLSASVDLVPGVTAEAGAQELSAELPGTRVIPVDDARAQILGPIAGSLQIAAILAVAAAVLLACTVTLLTVRLVTAVDQATSVVLAALGTPARLIRSRYALLIAVPLIVGGALGAIAAALLGEGIFNLLMEGLYSGFEMIGRGTSRIELIGIGWLALGLVPVALGLPIAASTALGLRGIHRTSIRTVVAE